MEFASALGICRSPAPAGMQETLDHAAAWRNSEVLECFSAGDLFKIPHNGNGDTKAVLVVW